MLCFDIETGSFAESLRKVRMSDPGTEFAEAAPHHNLFPAKRGEEESFDRRRRLDVNSSPSRARTRKLSLIVAA